MAINPRIKEAIRSTMFLKAMALIIGFLFWNVISESFTASRWFTVPVCFYNKTDQTIEAPETVMVELHGKRAHIRAIDPATLAVHIDASMLDAGPHHMIITRDALLLPPTIAVHTSIPHMIFVAVHPPFIPSDPRSGLYRGTATGGVAP
jgi:hypothetical protein